MSGLGESSVNDQSGVPPMQSKSGIWRTDRSMGCHQLAEYSALREVIEGHYFRGSHVKETC